MNTEARLTAQAFFIRHQIEKVLEGSDLYMEELGPKFLQRQDGVEGLSTKPHLGNAQEALKGVSVELRPFDAEFDVWPDRVTVDVNSRILYRTGRSCATAMGCVKTDYLVYEEALKTALPDAAEINIDALYIEPVEDDLYTVVRLVLSDQDSQWESVKKVPGLGYDADVQGAFEEGLVEGFQFGLMPKNK